MDETISNQQDSLPEPDGFANWPSWRKEEWRQRVAPPVLTENLTPASEVSDIPEGLVDPKNRIKKRLGNFDRVARAGFVADIMSEPTPTPTPTPEPEPKPESIPETPKEEKLFVDPTVFKHQVVAGDSFWSILKGIFETSVQFNNLDKKQQIYVLNNIAGIVFEKPENFGLGPNGALIIGREIDLTEVLQNDKEIEAVIKKAKEANLSDEVLKLEDSNWVMNQAGLKNEPKTEYKPEPGLEPEPKPEPKSILSEGGKGEIGAEIEKAKARLAELEKGEEEVVVEETKPTEVAEFVSPEKAASLRNGLRTMMGDANHQSGVEAAFRDEINSIYGKSGFLGMGQKTGLESSEWKEMARLPARQVVAYYTGDSTQSGLPPEILENLAKSKNHQALATQVVGLMEQASGAVKPFDNESMEQFIKRLGAYVLKNYSNPNLAKAA